MIDKATIDRIFAAANIVEVVGDFVTLKKKGINYQACCPFHNEKTPSFVVSPSKGLFKCFGCGKGGNAVTFVMEHENMTYPEALKYVARKYGIEVAEREQTPEEVRRNDDRESMMVVSSYAADYFVRTLHDTPEGQSIGIGYFRERGFSDATIRKFGLGYCPDGGDTFTRQALADGYKEEFLVGTGLTIKRETGGYYDRFCGPGNVPDPRDQRTRNRIRRPDDAHRQESREIPELAGIGDLPQKRRPVRNLFRQTGDHAAGLLHPGRRLHGRHLDAPVRNRKRSRLVGHLADGRANPIDRPLHAQRDGDLRRRQRRHQSLAARDRHDPERRPERAGRTAAGRRRPRLVRPQAQRDRTARFHPVARGRLHLVQDPVAAGRGGGRPAAQGGADCRHRAKHFGDSGRHHPFGLHARMFAANGDRRTDPAREIARAASNTRPATKPKSLSATRKSSAGARKTNRPP